MNPSRPWDDGHRKSESAISDGELVRAARRGDKKAFVEIVARHQAMVCGIALAILGDFAASEDVGQESFLLAWRKIQELREPERLKPWLAQIARNCALGQIRRQRPHEPLEEALTFTDETATPDQCAASKEESALVRESLSKLPETYRLPLVLFYREGKSVAATAETLGISEDAVKQRLARGREMLRDRMAGLIETVLDRTTPSAIFTMTIAAAIGALITPAAVAATAFSAASASSAVGSIQFLSDRYEYQQEFTDCSRRRGRGVYPGGIPCCWNSICIGSSRHPGCRQSASSSIAGGHSKSTAEF